jgi:hypothetical protein
MNGGLVLLPRHSAALGVAVRCGALWTVVLASLKPMSTSVHSPETTTLLGSRDGKAVP